MSSDTDDLLDAFFDAIVHGDLERVAALYADDVEVWHNVTGSALDKAGSIGLLRHWTRTVSDLRYEVLERRCFDGGAVQRHLLHGRAGDTPIAAQIALVFHVAEGRITRIYEYLDSGQVAAAFDR